MHRVRYRIFTSESVELSAFIFFLKMANNIKKVLVVGGGVMGSGIAQVIAQNGMKVSVVEQNSEALAKSAKRVKFSLDKISKSNKSVTDHEKWSESVLENIQFSTDIRDFGKSTDLVIEAISEKLEVKQELFKQLEKIVPEHTILTTNTSTLRIADVGSVIQTQHRFGGLHFFNPVPLMKLIEVIQTPQISQTNYQALLDFSRALGKVPIECKDTPGFVVNRLLFPLMVEAIRMYERGDADKSSIDQALKLGANHPLGPIQLADYIGLDLIHYAGDQWSQHEPDNSVFNRLKSVTQLVEEGKLGVKTGEGFYKYNKV